MRWVWGWGNGSQFFKDSFNNCISLTILQAGTVFFYTMPKTIGLWLLTGLPTYCSDLCIK